MSGKDHPTGKYYELFRPTAEKLRELFRAGIPVIAMGDGTTYRVEGPLPRDTDDTDT